MAAPQTRGMYDKPVSIVMIAYNEAGHIEQVLSEYCKDVFERLPEGSEFILYLDKPKDATADIAKRIAPGRGITLIDAPINLGYGKAMKKALATAKNQLIFYSDSSGKHRAVDFWKLLAVAEQFDIVTGLRKPRNYSLARRIVTFCQRMLVSVLFFMPLYDCNTGFKLVHKRVLDRVLDECKYTNQSFSSELLIRAHNAGFTIKNVPIVFSDRPGKNTGTNLKMLPRIMSHSFLGLLKLRRELLQKTFS